ncbi:MAG: 2-C-methyl-D-erythritol 4-phosphate cytidylyltransferase [Rhodobacterales bacterium]|nr:MAG: 2-C-methyl-D-erythritol 4-phosphate cytidylyltransferase [Rhodobacterales bacterium]
MSETEVKRPASLLLLNGGVGKRSGHEEPKQFYELHGHPMLAYSIVAALKVPEIQEIVVNAPEGYVERTERALRNYASTVPFKVVPCGATRQESSYILAKAASYDRVVLHESARPMVTGPMYRQLLEYPEENVGFFSDIPFSMCRLDPETGKIKRNVRRDRVFNIQLPQKFERDTLLAAHDAALKAGKTYTEDAVLVFKMTDADVYSLEGSHQNIKVTNREDFVIVKQLMSGGAK